MKPKDITDDELVQLDAELKRRLHKFRTFCSTETINSDWKLLVTDEASRNHFFRMVTAVACIADKSIEKSVEQGFGQVPQLLTAHAGCKEIINFVISASMAYEIQKGTFKLK